MTVAVRGRLHAVAKAAGVLSWPAARSAAIPGGIVLLALFLRVYRLEIISINFDTYEQLTATKRLLSAGYVEFHITLEFGHFSLDSAFRFRHKSRALSGSGHLYHALRARRGCPGGKECALLS